MHIYTYVAAGYTGHIVAVEVDIRRGIPGTDIVGLAGSAVREAKERVRVAVRRSGLHYPRDRVVVNLSPAGVPKSGAGLDLAIAIAVLLCAGQVVTVDSAPVLVLGELRLDGRVRRVSGVLAAVSEATRLGIRRYIVPAANAAEAKALGIGSALAITSLTGAVQAIETGIAPPVGTAENRGSGHGRGKPAVTCGAGESARRTASTVTQPNAIDNADGFDFRSFRGAPVVVRAMEIAAAGRHNLLLVGPPGSGKTLSARTLPSILAPLTIHEAVETTRIHSLAGVLKPGVGLLREAPFRSPHHTSSTEGMIGGGVVPHPGEISLAHHGVLFLDESLQFRRPVLQSLREPLESTRINLARAAGNYWFPADFQLLLAANPCPCGNLGRTNHHCLCSQAEVARYWRGIAGPILDRIELRVAAIPYHGSLLAAGEGESSAAIRERVLEAIERQRSRYRARQYNRNVRIPPHEIAVVTRPSDNALEALSAVVDALDLSNRAQHAVLRVARTIADLSAAERIGRLHLLEAVQYRRLGESGAILADDLVPMPRA